jgi:hypothetical protein
MVSQKTSHVKADFLVSDSLLLRQQTLAQGDLTSFGFEVEDFEVREGIQE